MLESLVMACNWEISLCFVSIEISSPLSFKTNEENEKLHFIKQITL